ncbi:lysosome-associated membrane glycoprotein 3 isoform X1 [Marmota monax]|uniref:Lysosome-associated membrane glycoprotein 3 n=1 Tax=Marmota monax TaxID=9995 RepID=A0A834QA78_MARMO|nr:lysosome-associated membrane glycoprotein 3 isoform X1 [Marmota monax]KAF7475391.1 lysosome-associated membrane glycoprotein 3 [Marmota monax]
MPRQLSAVVVLSVSLAVILHDGPPIRATAFPESRHHLQPTEVATGQITAKLTHQGPHKAVAARSMEGHITSPTAVKTSNSENPRNTTMKTPPATPVTIKSNPSASPVTFTLATPNKSHPVTEATIGPTLTLSESPITPPAPTAGTSTSAVSHTTRKTIQPSEQTTLPKTLSTIPHKSTTSPKPSPLTHAPGTSPGSHNVTQTIPPATIVPGPTLVPQPSPAKTGVYQVLNGSRLCIKAEMGIQLIVQEKESAFSPPRYFNIDPNTTQASGNCGSRNSSLFLNFKGGSVNFTFTKEENSYYISEVEAYLTVSNPEKAYKGMKSAVMMFETVVGHSFKCVSEQSIQLSPQLQLKTMNVQLQAFDFEGDHFGNADECFSDRNRREIPVAVGLSIAGLLVIWLTACLVARKRPNRGYERM